MSSSDFNLDLTKMAQGDISVAGQVCKKIANRFIAVPASEKEEGEKVLVRAFLLSSEHGKDTPIFTSENLLKEWCKSNKVESGHIKLLAADFCAALGADLNLLVDPGSPHEVRLTPTMVDDIACTPSDLKPNVKVLGPSGSAEVVESVKPEAKPELKPWDSVDLTLLEGPVESGKDSLSGTLTDPSVSKDKGLEAKKQEPDQTKGKQPHAPSAPNLSEERKENIALREDVLAKNSDSDKANPEREREMTRELDPFEEFDMKRDSPKKTLTARPTQPTQIIETEQATLTQDKGSFKPRGDTNSTQFVKPLSRAKVESDSIASRFKFPERKKPLSNQE
jgi:hypothetical protein